MEYETQRNEGKCDNCNTHTPMSIKSNRRGETVSSASVGLGHFLMGTDRFKNLDTHGRIILKQILKYCGGSVLENYVGQDRISVS